MKLVELSSEAHNNSVGRVERFDGAAGRYHVSVRDGAASIAVRPDNLRQIITSARVVGLRSQPHLNGRVAASATYDPRSKRYCAEGLSENGSTLSLKPENLMLPQSTRVLIDGVQSRPSLNGRRGQIVGVDDERYVVELPGEEPVKLRYGAVIAM